MNLTHFFDLSLKGRSDAVALEFQGGTYTFGDVEARSNRMAHLLDRRGLKQGDRLCVYLPNCVEMIDLYLACVKLGVIFVPINILYRDREISHIVEDAEPAVVITEADLASLNGGRRNAVRASARRARRGCARGYHLYFRDHGRVERRGVDTQ